MSALVIFSPRPPNGRFPERSSHTDRPSMAAREPSLENSSPRARKADINRRSHPPSELGGGGSVSGGTSTSMVSVSVTTVVTGYGTETVTVGTETVLASLAQPVSSAGTATTLATASRVRTTHHPFGPVVVANWTDVSLRIGLRQ